MQVAHRELTTAAEVFKNAAEVRRRLMNARKKLDPTELDPSGRSAIAKRVVMRLPDFTSVQKHYDDHIRYYDKWFVATHFERLRMYIDRRAIILGFSLADILGDQRVAELVAARQRLIWEVAMEQASKLSYSQLGRLFHRDHTTVLHSLRVIAKQDGIDLEPQLQPGRRVGNNPDALAKIKAMIGRGEKMSDIAREIGASTTSVFEHARRMGWIEPKKYRTRKGDKA